MPIFEYICNDCNKEFDVLVHSSNQYDIKCVSCESSSVKKKLSSFAVNTISTSAPECSSGCGGFEKGSCGSGMCGL